MMIEIDVFLKILLSAVLGGMVGLERERSQKEAGLRTNILIAVGATLLTILALRLPALAQGADPGRLTGHIVSGIGFLGAGAIIQARFAVHGLTTAASIWTVAAIGITVGLGLHLTALLVTLFVLVVLVFFKALSRAIEKQRKLFAYLLKTEDRAALLMEIKRVITELGIRYQSATVSRQKGGFTIEVLLTTSEGKNREFVESVLQLKGVREITSETL